jgi:hypothetical protein
MNQSVIVGQETVLNAKLKALETQLEHARQNKAALAREREKQEFERQHKLNDDELQCQIDELNQQLNQQEFQLKGVESLRTFSKPEALEQPTMEQQLLLQSCENEPVKGYSEQAKQKHSWEKPNWALPSEIISDASIIKDSIQSPLLKAVASSGYERKVHKADIALIPGKFVQPSKATVVEPRMVWIVVNIDGSKVGKIVMHLYGNFLPLTDIFTELKGLELTRCNSTTFVVKDVDPNFYVHAGTVLSFCQCFTTQATADCFGLILEGMDIFQQLLNAPNDAVFTIKQSHIFPVKKTK